MFADTSSLVWHIREGLGVGDRYKSLDVPFVHVSMFVTDGVALVSMAVLSFERILALLLPHRQFSRRTQIIILLASWPISVSIFLPYMTVGFLDELIIFFSCTNSIAVTSLILLTAIYRTKFRSPYDVKQEKTRHSNSITNSTTNLSSGFNSATESTNVPTEITTSPTIITMDATALDGEMIISENAGESRDLSTTERGVEPIETKTDEIENPTQVSSSASPLSSPLNQKRSVTNIGLFSKRLKESSLDIKLTSYVPQSSKGLHQADPIEVRMIEQTVLPRNSSRVDLTASMKETEQPQQNQKKRSKRSTSIANIAILALPFQRTSSSNTSMRTKQSKKQRKVTVAFLKMLLVFIITYLPTLVMVVGLHVPGVNCDTIHVFRDLSVLGILSSSLFRAVNFLATLRHLQRSIKKLFFFKK